MWRMNLARAVGALGSPSMLGEPVWKVWANDHAIYHTKPDPIKYTSGSRRGGEKLYNTEPEAWAALLFAFDDLATEKRTAIIEKKNDVEMGAK